MCPIHLTKLLCVLYCLFSYRYYTELYWYIISQRYWLVLQRALIRLFCVLFTVLNITGVIIYFLSLCYCLNHCLPLCENAMIMFCNIYRLLDNHCVFPFQPEEKSTFDGIFESLFPVNGLLSGDKVKPILINSKLPLDVLGKVLNSNIVVF